MGRLEFFGSNGEVGDSVEYDDEERMVAAILDENYYGIPMNVVLYRDESGKTIDQGFVAKLDPPNIKLEFTDIPEYLNNNEGMGGMV